MQEQDTVNLQYISILQKEVKAYKGLKDFEKVAALRESIISIIDGIKISYENILFVRMFL